MPGGRAGQGERACLGGMHAQGVCMGVLPRPPPQVDTTRYSHPMHSSLDNCFH